MLRLLDLIPEKKSLLQAQKAMQCRRMDEVMDALCKDWAVASDHQ